MKIPLRSSFQMGLALWHSGVFCNIHWYTLACHLMWFHVWVPWELRGEGHLVMVVCKHRTYQTGLTLPRCFLQTYLALLTSVPYIFSIEGWPKGLIGFLCCGRIHDCSFDTLSPSDPTTSLAGFQILSDFSELFALRFTVLYKTLCRYFFRPFNLLFGLSHFVSFPHLFAYSLVMSQQINTHFLNEFISNLTKIESSLSTTVFEGLKLK